MRTIIKLPVDSIFDFPGNPKEHPEEQIDMLCKSIKQFGFNNPLLVDEEHTLLGGHGRLMAAKQLGMEYVDCIVVGGLTPMQKKAYVIADNKIATLGEWNEDKLQAIVSSIASEEDIDLLGSMGMSDSELDYFTVMEDDLAFEFKEEEVVNVPQKILEISQQEATTQKEKVVKHCIILEFTSEDEKEAAYSELLGWSQLFNTINIKTVNY